MRNQIPHFLSVYLLAVAVYVTLTILEKQPVRAYVQRAYSQLDRRKKMLSYLIVFAIGGLLLCGYWWASRFIADAIKTKPDSQIEALAKKLDGLQEAFTKSPSVPDAAKIPILQDQLSELSKNKEALTKREKEILDQSALTLDSLETARKQFQERQKVEQKEQELSKQKEEIAQKQQEKQLDEQARRMAAPMIPVVNYAITTLYNMLRNISAEPIYTDFPNNPPSIYQSNLLKDSMLTARGGHSLRIGSRKEWEFYCGVSGFYGSGGRIADARSFNFSIRAAHLTGSPVLTISANGSVTTEFSDGLEIVCGSGDKRIFRETCSLTDYEKPLERALKELIQACYNAAPLPPKS